MRSVSPRRFTIFEKRGVKRVFAIGTARSNRVVAFAQCREHVRQCLQRSNHALAENQGGDHPPAADEQSKRPLHFAAIPAAPQQDHRDHDARQTGKQGEAEDQALVRGPSG